MELVVVVLSPLLEVGVKVLLPERVRYRLPSDWLLPERVRYRLPSDWSWLVIRVIVLSIIWPALWQLSAIFARVVLLPFLDILT